MTHSNMRNVRREAQLFETDRILPGQSGGPSQTVVLTDGGAESVLTSFTKTFEETISQPATTFVTTRTDVIRVTDSAQYTSLQASQSSAKATTAAVNTSSSPAETSEAASQDASSSNLSTLIPAIVVPVAAVLIISFLIFWFVMRRRHQRQLNREPEFVMARKPEKPISRGNSNSSGHSSTRELVPMSKLEKEVAITTSETRKSSLELFPPKYSSADIGVARPMTPPDKKGAAQHKKQRSFTNFSSVRPSTSHKSKWSQDRSNSSRNGSISSSVQRSLQQSRSAGKNSPPKSSQGMPPQGVAPQRPLRPDEQNLRAGPMSPSRAPPPIATNMSNGNRAAPPKPLNPPTPTGAFNGASPISQYSPIVKDQFNIGAVATSNESDYRGQAPVSLKTATFSPGHGNDSPVDENVLSRENMRIARLANSSVLGSSNTPEESDFPLRGSSKTKVQPSLHEGHSKTDATTTSPRLPPPLTREDMPPKPFARGLDSPAGGSSIYPSPSIGPGLTPRIGNVHGGSSNDIYPRESMVSRLSSDDGYVDMEVDAKSEVSSLDERERWEVESDRETLGSRFGMGYNVGEYGRSPIDGPSGLSSAGTGATKPSIRDRDSEGPFVLSRY